jgi:predicted nucleotidyltransferase
MKIENLKEVLEEIVKRLEEGLHPEQIILFGSYAYGELTERSDVDLLIVVPDSIEPAYRRVQRAYRCVGAVGIPKDLVVLTREEFERQARVVTSLARRARDRGKVLYERREARRDPKVADQESA